MTNREKAELVAAFLQKEFGQVATFLSFDREKPWQFLFCVMLSAQATDRSVNRVTPTLFARFPTIQSLAEADPREIEAIVRPVGLAPTKSKNIVAAARSITGPLHGDIPLDRKKLTELPGVGYKTAGVFLGEIYDFPYIPVDTHVERVSRTLGLVRRNLDRVQIEASLERSFKGLGEPINIHRQLILFGRTYCRPSITGQQAWDYIRAKLSENKVNS